MLKKKKKYKLPHTSPTLSPVSSGLKSLLCSLLPCQEHALFFKFLWWMSVKYQKPAMELSVSHLVFHFCPCRALTSLMKTHLPGCLFFPCLLMTRESWAQPVGNKRLSRQGLTSRDVFVFWLGPLSKDLQNKTLCCCFKIPTCNWYQSTNVTPSWNCAVVNLSVQMLTKSLLTKSLLAKWKTPNFSDNKCWLK